MAGQQGPAPALEVGQPFNPFGLFTGIFIPNALVRSTIISPGAKLVYGRLARYAGQDGRCYPAVETLASEVGLGERQVKRYLAELEREHLIRRVIRYPQPELWGLGKRAHAGGDGGVARRMGDFLAVRHGSRCPEPGKASVKVCSCLGRPFRLLLC